MFFFGVKQLWENKKAREIGIENSSSSVKDDLEQKTLWEDWMEKNSVFAILHVGNTIRRFVCLKYIVSEGVLGS